MKRLLFLLLFFIGFSSVAQTYVEKYNSLNGRYEYFDKQTNKMVAYKFYNSLNGAWETTYVNNNQQGSGRYVPQKQRTDDNFALLQQVMADKQARFDYNKQRIQNYVNSIYMHTKIFNEKCVKSINNRNYDYSSDVLTNKVLNYLNDCYNQIVYETKTKYKPSNNTYTYQSESYKTSFINSSMRKLQSKPNINSQVIYVAPENSTVTVLSRHDELWYKVRVNGNTGYITKNNLIDK